MRDPRIDNLADVLVGYSTEVKLGDLVLISGPPLTSALITSIYRAVIHAGAHPVLSVVPDECKEIMLNEGQEHQITYEDPVAQFQIEEIDVLIAIWGQTNTKSLTGVSPERQAKASQARKKYLDTYLKRAAAGELRWVGTQFPCNASAQDAEMSLSAYEDFVFRAGLLDREKPAEAWRHISDSQQRLVDYLNGKKEIRFVTPQGTDLTLGIEGRQWLNCDGHENFPDGEVFTGPIEDATQGIVNYSFPAVHGGREVDDISFTFKDGKVVEESASKGDEFLKAMLDQDAGARILGEIAIGTNYSITDYTKNTLFDEKIGGTFHAAVGSSYPESGGKNQSGLHWDMVCDLREGGQIFIDGELLSENGRFIDERFPQPNA